MVKSNGLRRPLFAETHQTSQELISAALAHRLAGRLDKARRSLLRALDKSPTHSNALFELGELNILSGTPHKAVPYFAAALKVATAEPTYWGGLVKALIASDRTSEAREIVERFQTSGFEKSDVRLALIDSGKLAFQAARQSYTKNNLIAAEMLVDIAILIDDMNHAAIHLAGLIALKTNRIDLGLNLTNIAIHKNPNNSEYFATLGRILNARFDVIGARAAFDRAIELAPDSSSLHADLAGVLHQCGEYKQAFRHAQQAVKLNPKLPDGHGQMATAFMLSGQLQNAISGYDCVIRLAPENVSARSNRLFAKLYSENITPEEYAFEAKDFGRRFTSSVFRNRPFLNKIDPKRLLRVGFVSGDFCNHPVTHFFKPFLTRATKESFAFIGFMTNPNEDAESEKLRKLFHKWHNITKIDDDAAADLVEAENVDILVDLSGHTAGHRLLVFGRKPAPIQVTWIGYPATTGLNAIDYRLTDNMHDPENETDALHTEALWRLPRIQASYLKPAVAPDVCKQAPFEKNGYITFGSFNRYAKVSDENLKMWAQIISRTSGSRLLMVVADIEDIARRHEIEKRLAIAGLPLDRIDLHSRVSKSEYYNLYNNIDIALDTFPYNGGTTSCDALWMGVPFISLAGKHSAARTGLAVLNTVGLEELTTTDRDNYVVIAQSLASDLDRLRSLRLGLRDKVAASLLMNHQDLADAVTDSFRSMWIRWCNKQSKNYSN